MISYYEWNLARDVIEEDQVEISRPHVQLGYACAAGPLLVQDHVTYTAVRSLPARIPIAEQNKTKQNMNWSITQDIVVDFQKFHTHSIRRTLTPKDQSTAGRTGQCKS
jgi:hypothetical protein